MRYIRYRIGFILSPEGDAGPTHFDLHAGIKREWMRPLSAGFVRFKDGLPECYGKSVSLDLNADESDSKALAEQLGIPHP